MRSIVFPQPREVQTQDGTVRIDDAVVLIAPSSDPMEREAASLLVRVIERYTGNAPEIGGEEPADHRTRFLVWVGERAGEMDLPPDPEGYTLTVDASGIRLRGTTPMGTWHAAQTLCQLIEQEGAELPHLTVRDWPHMRHRGLFVECKWGPDRMTLDDWKHAVDKCASLKFNFLGVGVYGCWVVQYDNRITEFLMLPLPDIPEAATPKTIRYYSPSAGEQTIEYLPEMFEKDFFGELVAYGRSRGVVIRPQFNSLGHNTLIPRLRPEVSARDAEGNPTGYGYCTSSPETERLVFGMYDHVLDKYLFPNGVSSFHVGLDEVWSSIGVDPDDPHRAVEPWCKCPKCRERSSEDLFLDWMLRLCVHLKERGVEQIAIWNDQLTRHMNLLDDELVRRLDELGLSERVVIEWWWYSHRNAFTTIRPELGLKRWVVPMTGYYHWWPYQSYLRNVHAMMAVGVEQGAEGTESYCTFDEGFDRNYRYQSEWAWNPTAAMDLGAFREKYARGIFGDRWERGLLALNAFDRVAEPGELNDLVRSLMPYRYTYVAVDQPYPRRYPREVIGSLRSNVSGSMGRLAEAARYAGEARVGFQELSDTGALAGQYAAESHRIETLANTFLSLLSIDEMLRRGGEGERKLAIGQARAALHGFDAMMDDLESVKAHYLLPQMLRDLTTLREYLARVLEMLPQVEPCADILTTALPDVPE